MSPAAACVAKIGDPRLPARFWAKVTVTEGGCWRWTGATARGYGAFKLTTRHTTSTHRLAFEALVGPVPHGLELDHTCHTNDPSCAGGPTCLHRACCNPAHLEAVTHRENNLRSPVLGRALAKAQQVVRDRTHCPSAHPYDDENTGWTKSGWRYCRACNRARAARNYEKRKAA